MAGPGASLAFVHSVMGLAPGWGSGRRLVDLLGKRRALDLLLTSRKVKLEEGLSLGLIDCEVDGLDQTEKWILSRVNTEFPQVSRAIKTIVSSSSHPNSSHQS